MCLNIGHVANVEKIILMCLFLSYSWFCNGHMVHYLLTYAYFLPIRNMVSISHYYNIRSYVVWKFASELVVSDFFSADLKPALYLHLAGLSTIICSCCPLKPYIWILFRQWICCSTLLVSYTTIINHTTFIQLSWQIPLKGDVLYSWQ